MNTARPASTAASVLALTCWGGAHATPNDANFGNNIDTKARTVADRNFKALHQRITGRKFDTALQWEHELRQYGRSVQGQHLPVMRNSQRLEKTCRPGY